MVSSTKNMKGRVERRRILTVMNKPTFVPRSAHQPKIHEYVFAFTQGMREQRISVYTLRAMYSDGTMAVSKNDMEQRQWKN